MYGQSKYGGDRLADQLGAIQRRQFDKPRAVREALQQVGAHL
jgi:hypothetical protein